MKLSKIRLCLVASIAATLFTHFSTAATLSGSVSADSPFNTEKSFNLTDLGTSDWAYWDTSDNPASGVATNSKSGGSLIGDITAINGTGIQGTGSSTKPAASFSFTDGTSPVSGSVSQVTGLFNKTLGTEGVGVSLTINLATTDEYTIYLWASAFDVQTGTLTASLNGATDYITTISDASVSDGVKDTYLITIVASANQPGDDLTIDLVNTVDGNSGSFGHVILNAAAVAVPEPATTALIVPGLGFLCVLVMRKRNPVLR